MGNLSLNGEILVYFVVALTSISISFNQNPLGKKLPLGSFIPCMTPKCSGG
jgi:hypothetical protein